MFLMHLHINVEHWEHHCKVWVKYLEGLVEGCKLWTALEQARSKLLLMECPRGALGVRGLATGLPLWKTAGNDA